MKSQLLLVSLGLLLYLSTRVDGKCYSCAYKVDKTKCSDPYTPSGPESDACKGPTNGYLCRKYNGGYTISCDTGLAEYVYCSMQESPCPDKAGQIHQVFSFVMLLSGVVTLVTRMRF